MKNENDNEERLIETIVTIGSLIFFALLTMYAMRGCSEGEGIKGDLVATTVATTATATTVATAIAGENSANEATGLMADVNGTADVNATMDADVNATTDADVNATMDADVNATTDADVNATTDADANATTDADVNATTDADANATTDADVTKAKGKTEAEEEAGIIADIKSSKISAKPYVLKGISFRSGSSILTKKSKRQLDAIANALKANKDVKVTLRGHTDSKGSKKENQALSMKRARSVGMAFVERGVNIDNIWIDGMGETEPITKNGTAKEMLLNRRVDISVTK